MKNKDTSNKHKVRLESSNSIIIVDFLLFSISIDFFFHPSRANKNGIFYTIHCRFYCNACAFVLRWIFTPLFVSFEIFRYTLNHRSIRFDPIIIKHRQFFSHEYVATERKNMLMSMRWIFSQLFSPLSKVGTI